MTKKPSFRAQWLNRRIWRWRRNKLKHRIKLWVSATYRREYREYETLLEQEKAEVKALLESLPDHIEACFVGQNPYWTVCPSGKSLHSEKPFEHWWSGWPGAFCMKCFAGDLMESCIGCVCECQCHDEFWEGYNEAMREPSE